MQGSGWVGYGERWEDIPSGCLRVSFGLIKKKSSRKLGIFFARFFSFLKDLQYFYSLNLKLCWGNDFKRSFSEEG